MRVFPKPFGATRAWEDRFRLDRNSSTSVVRSNTELWELLKSLSSVSCCASSTHAGIPTSRKISFCDRRPVAWGLARTKVQLRRIWAPLKLRQVRPPLPRDPFRFRPPPFGDLRVVAREQHLRNRATLPYARARIVRIFEQALLEALLLARSVLAHHSGDEPHAGVEDRQRGDLAAREHVVADRDLDQPTRLDDPFVDALEARAEDDEARPR